MKRRSAVILSSLISAIAAYSAVPKTKSQPKIHITGFFHEANEHSGNFYGHTILVYRGVDYWVIYQRIDEQEMPPIATQAKIMGNSIEFTVEPTPGEKATFRGKIYKDYLIGEFDNLSQTIKLMRRQL
jgi:hypothetical protein